MKKRLCGFTLHQQVPAAHQLSKMHLNRQPEAALKCPGVGRDKDCISALQFYFNRPVTDDEMRFLHEVMQRTVACMPKVETKKLLASTALAALAALALCASSPRPAADPQAGSAGDGGTQ
jgi:hypothetical protein